MGPLLRRLARLLLASFALLAAGLALYTLLSKAPVRPQPEHDEQRRPGGTLAAVSQQAAQVASDGEEAAAAKGIAAVTLFGVLKDVPDLEGTSPARQWRRNTTAERPQRETDSVRRERGRGDIVDERDGNESALGKLSPASLQWWNSMARASWVVVVGGTAGSATEKEGRERWERRTGNNEPPVCLIYFWLPRFLSRLPQRYQKSGLRATAWCSLQSMLRGLERRSGTKRKRLNACMQPSL